MPSDFRARLEAKGLLGRCEACGEAARWTIAADDYVLVPVREEGSRMPLNAMVCGNCAHVRLFAATAL